MGEVVNKLNLKQALEGVKTYVDNQATAQVIRTETTLYESTAGLSSGDVVTLSQSMDNFDALKIEAGLAGSTEVQNGPIYRRDIKEIPVSDFSEGGQAAFTFFNGALFGTDTTMRLFSLTLGRTASNQLTVANVDRQGNLSSNPIGIRRITGIKYTVPETYSTNEQIVGTWIDGRPLYQKTITATTTSSLNTWQTFPHNISNVDSVVDFTGRRFNPNLGETYDVNYYHSSGGVNVTTAGTVDRTNIYFKTSVDNSGQTLIYTLKYVKTGGA